MTQPSKYHEAKAAIACPDRVLLPYEVHAQFGEFVRRNPGTAREGYARPLAQLIELGLKTSGLETVAKNLESQLADLHRLLSAAVGLDEAPHPQPKGVAPETWEHREQDRVRKIREHQAAALKEAQGLVGRALKSLREAT
jgi:hypothetical protein